MGINRAFSARNLLLLLLVIILFFGIGYKVFEWRTLTKFSELNSKTVPEELLIIEKSNKNYEEIIGLFVKLLSENLTTEEQLDLLEEMDGKTNLAINISNEYLTTISKNKKSYERLELPSRVLFGKNGKFAREFITNQIKYYNEEVTGASENIISNHLAKSIFLVMKDRAVMLDFDDRASVAPTTNYSKYFADIASLEKYTRDDFEFSEEQRIKELFPYGHEALDKNRDYMSAYYSVVKDFVAGDYESANYKYSRIEESYLELNIDFEKLFSEGEDRDKERAKKIIEYVVAKNKAIKDFKKDKLGVYPLLPKVDGWKDNLELCQLYAYKSDFYNSVLKKYPEAKDFDSLITELTQLAPSTSSVDSEFDKEVIKFTNTDEAIQFECTDKEAGIIYSFAVSK